MAHIYTYAIYTYTICHLYMKKRFYLSIFRARGKEGERERNINVWLPLPRSLNGDLACNPGMCPDWQSSQRPFASQAWAQPTEIHHIGLYTKKSLKILIFF